MQNITTNKNCVFKFPYKKLKSRYWREKVSTWIVEETFKKTMDIDEEIKFEIPRKVKQLLDE